jgi:glyoxylate reductase
VCVTPGEIFENTADLTFALLMAAARRIPEADAYIRAGRYHQWGPATLLGADIYGKTLGLLGLGQIGSAVARRARGFDMNIIYTTAHGRKPELEEQLGCRYVSFEELMEQSDFLSLHCKLSPQTEHLIGKTELGMMKKSAFLINTARGKIVDERALADALINRTIAGAALDVFEYEPKVTEALLTLDNVVMTPHLGASSADNRLQMAKIAAECTRDALSGKEPRYHV